MYFYVNNIFYSKFTDAILITVFSMDLHKRAIESKTLTHLAYVLPDIITTSMCASFGGYYGLKRMKNMIIYLNRLDKVVFI